MLPYWRAAPLPVLSAPWETISVDIIIKLLESSGNDAVMVVVDSITKRAHFAPMLTTITASGMAHLFLQHVWHHHRLPRRVVSQFIAEFTWELYRTLRIKLATTTAYHPQGNRQTEWVNQELEQYHQLFVNQRQDDWL